MTSSKKRAALPGNASRRADDLFSFSSMKESYAFLKFVEDGVSTEKLLQKALAAISKTADKYMKRMYLRWKKMGVEDKQKFERAIANQRRQPNNLSVTFDNDDNKMETKLSTVKPPKLAPISKAGDAKPRPRVTGIKPKPVRKGRKAKVSAVQPKIETKTDGDKPRTKMTGIKPKPVPKAKMSTVQPKTKTKTKGRVTKPCPKTKLGVASRTRTPNPKRNVTEPKPKIKRNRVAKPKPEAKPKRMSLGALMQSIAGPQVTKPVKRKVAGVKTAPKSIRTIKKIKTRKTK